VDTDRIVECAVIYARVAASVLAPGVSDVDRTQL
jgi:hypothetical protein